jgi:acyl carrier protein
VVLGIARNAPARDEIERAIHAAFAGVLGLEMIAIHESFFELGGHSLRATRLAHLLQDALGVDVALIDIFQAPTIASLADRLRTRAPSADRIHAVVAPLSAEERHLLGDV